MSVSTMIILTILILITGATISILIVIILGCRFRAVLASGSGVGAESSHDLGVLVLKRL